MEWTLVVCLHVLRSPRSKVPLLVLDMTRPIMLAEGRFRIKDISAHFAFHFVQQGVLAFCPPVATPALRDDPLNI